MRKGWRKGAFADCIDSIVSGKSVNSLDEPVDGSDIGVLKTSCVYNGKFEPRQNKKVVDHEVALVKCPARKGSIVVSRMNTASLVGASGLVEEDHPNLYLPDRLWCVTPKATVDAHWFSFVVGSPATRRRLSDVASGTSASMKNISQDAFLNMPVDIPSLQEQRKIARILSAWDQALEDLRQLRELKQLRLSGLRADLLFGRRRLEGCEDRWATIRLGDVTHELTVRNENLELQYEHVMGVTNTAGIVPMREQTISNDIRRYKRAPPYAFAYNPMRINVGSIAMNSTERAILVSPDYVVFACDADALLPDYLDHLRNTQWWSHYINSGGSGSVRQRTYYVDLAGLKVALPSLGEQRAICRVLNAAREDVRLTKCEGQRISDQKRGLMQKLLTGEWRFLANQAKEAAG